MIGVVLLVHGNLYRAGQLASHLADAGCAVVIHADKRSDRARYRSLKESLGSHPNMRFAPQRSCEWGRFSLVEASLDAVRLLLDTWPGVTHAVQLSGACLPLQPMAALRAHLAARPDTDFIEAIPVAKDPWVIGGLSAERYTLYHPFSWKRQRRLFDMSVKIQRALRIRRRLPDNLQPCIGSQWWCLSRATLDAILGDPRLEAYARFFRQSWIPDETFFQTLATKHSTNIDTTPLTFVRFDPQGKPFSFYDDHLDLLLGVDAFFARKIWPGAAQLYTTFLGAEPPATERTQGRTGDVLKRLARARSLRVKGRRGMLGPGRHPLNRKRQPQYQTARPYTVLDGVYEVLPSLRDGLNSDPRMRAHGALFGPGDADFFDGSGMFDGNLPAKQGIRDYRPKQFLVNLLLY